MHRHICAELTNCKKWLVDNKLSLHIGKTECLLFGSKSKLKKVENFEVSCEGRAVQQVNQVKYLGVFLDASLAGGAHFHHVLKLCVGRLSFLYRHSQLLDFHCRKILCTSRIQPYLD